MTHSLKQCVWRGTSHFSHTNTVFRSGRLLRAQNRQFLRLGFPLPSSSSLTIQ